MKKIFWLIVFLIITTNLISKELNIVTTYPYIASIVKYIGGNDVNVAPLADGRWNPHTILPKPSYISKLRNADLLIINGAQLEIGWLPQLVRQANNPKIQFESSGFLDLSNYVTLIDIPKNISRALGDVHPEGNPHFYLDYKNILPIAEAIKNKLSELNPEKAKSFNNNYTEFKNHLENKITIWEEKLKNLKSIKVIEYHKIFDYFINRAELTLIGTIEPLPGIPPTSRHIEEMEKLIKTNNVKYILQDVYNPQDAGNYLSKKYNIKTIILPHDVGATGEAKDIFSLIDTIVERLTND